MNFDNLKSVSITVNYCTESFHIHSPDNQKMTLGPSISLKFRGETWRGFVLQFFMVMRHLEGLLISKTVS